MNRYRLFEAGTIIDNSFSISIPDGIKSRAKQNTSPNIVPKDALMAIGFSEELSEILIASWMTHSELPFRGGFDNQSLCEMVDMTSFKIARSIRMSPLKESFRLFANNIEVPNPGFIKQQINEAFKFWALVLKSINSKNFDTRFGVIPNIPQADPIAFSLSYSTDMEYCLRLLCVPMKWILEGLADSEIALILFCVWKSIISEEEKSKWVTSKESGIFCGYSMSTMSSAAREIESKYPQIIERRTKPYCFALSSLEELLDLLSGKLEEWNNGLNKILDRFSQIQSNRLTSKRVHFQGISIPKSTVEKIVSETKSGNLKGGFLIGHFDVLNKQIIVDEFQGVKCKTSKRTHFAYDWNSENGYHRTKAMIRKKDKMIVAEYHSHRESAEPHPSDIRRMEKLASRYSGGIWMIFSPNDQYAFSTHIKDGKFQNDCIEVNLV